MAVLRGTHVIQNANDLFDFCSENLTSTIKESASCSRRVFKFLSCVNRERPDRYFETIKDNRKIHQAVNIAASDGIIRTRSLSCYECDKCTAGKYHQCCNNYLDKSQVIRMKTKGDFTEQENSVAEDDSVELEMKSLVQPGVICA